MPVAADPFNARSSSGLTGTGRGPPGFTVLDELGHGTHTVTYRVRRHDTDYAMKVLSRTDSGGVSEQTFRREAALLASIDDRGIARVHEVGVWAGHPYLVMDLVEGRRLSELLALGPLPVPRLVSVGIDVASALRAAHRAGVVHRDVKPDNIIVGPDGRASVIDFGLAVRSGDRDDTVSGTLRYCAPEQAGLLNRPVDGRSDLYALGTVLYECATGRPPFVSSDIGQLLRMHASSPPPDPLQARPELPPALAAVIGRLLAKDPDDRYQSPTGLIADLRLVQADPDTPLGTAALALGTADAPVSATALPLVDREAERRTLLQRWDRARLGAGGAVLLEGPPGVGKSRLAREVVDTASAAGALVLAGKSEPDQSVPLAPLRAAIDDHVRGALALAEPARSAAIERLVDAAGSAAALLRHLSPALDAVLDAPTLSEDDRHQQFSTAVAGFLVALARASGGAVLHLDDVQWLDDATRGVLRQVAPALPDEPLLLVATARSDPANGLAVSALRSVLGNALDVDLRLGPLSRDGVSELISAVSGGLRVDDDTVARLTARSDGNPFTLLQYLNAIVDAGLLSPSWGRWVVDLERLQSLDLPVSGRELVISRLDDLDDESRYVLGVAAVVGPQFSPDLVAAVAGTDLRRTRTVANAASTRNLVERRGNGQFAFVHDQIREALTAAFDEPTRRGVHERIADVLEAQLRDRTEHNAEHEHEPEYEAEHEAETVYALAQHCKLAGVEHRPDRVVRACTDAGRLALTAQAPAEALAFLRTAAEAASKSGQELDADFLLAMGIAQHRCGQFQDAVGTLRTALTRSHDPIRRATILGLIARVHDSTWNTGEQAAAVEQALIELGCPLPKNPFVRVAMTLWRFLLGVLVGVTRIGLGTASGSTLEHHRLVASLYDAAALAYARQLRPAQAVVFTLRELYPVNRIGPGPERARQAIAAAHLAQVVGLHRFGRRLTARAERTAAASGDPRLSAYVAWLKALDRYFFGVDQGESIRETLANWGRWLDPGPAGDLMLAIHWDALMRGDLSDAAELFDRRDAILATSDQSGRMVVHAARAGLLALRGHADEAVAHLDRMRASRPDPLPWETVDLIFATLLTAVEQHDLGAAFDGAADEFKALGLNPLELVPVQRGLFVYLAYGRVEQCRDAPDHDGIAATAAASSAAAAVKLLRRAANTPLLRAHHSVVSASLRQVRGADDAALLELNRTEPLRRAVDAPLVMFEAARVRAHALRALRITRESELAARVALSLAEAQGWPERARHVAAEFGLTTVGRHDVGHDDAGYDDVGHDGAGRGGAGRSSAGRGAAPVGDNVVLDRFRQRLAAIEQVGLAASRVVDPARLVTIALDETVRILGAERALLFLLEEHGDEPARLVPQLGRDAAGHDIDDLSGYSASLIERVHRSREALVVTSTDQGVAMGAQSVVLHGLRSVLVAPLQLEGRLLGLVYLDSRVAQGIFSEDDVGVLVAITNHIAVALETARAAQLEVAVATANRQRDLAETMRDALAEITGPLESKPERVLWRLLGTVRRLVGDDQAWLVLSEEDGRPVRIVGEPDDDGSGPDESTVEPDWALVQLLRTEKAELARLPDERPALVAGAPGAVCWLSVPLLARGDRVGLLLVASADAAAYDQGRSEIVTTLVGQAMVGYENARLFARVREMATTDELTGIANRWYFFESAGRALAAARGSGGPLAVMMIDIDHFKVVNDTHGHQVGDEVIQAVADRLTRVAGLYDLVGRYGGEEFVVVVPAHETDAVATAERFRRAVSASTVITRAGPLDVTVSVGVTYLRDDDVDLTEVLARADRCLLRAKRSGRDRVFFSRD